MRKGLWEREWETPGKTGRVGRYAYGNRLTNTDKPVLNPHAEGRKKTPRE